MQTPEKDAPDVFELLCCLRLARFRDALELMIAGCCQASSPASHMVSLASIAMNINNVISGTITCNSAQGSLCALGDMHVL